MNQELEAEVEALEEGAIFIYPTDTVYGLGCVFDNERAVKEIRKLKGRGEDKPLSLAFASVNMLRDYAHISMEGRGYLASKLPGPYTFIVQSGGNVPHYINNGKGRLGVRVPDHPQLLELISALGKPIVTTSANKSGQPAPNTLNDIPKEIKDKVDYIWDDGKCAIGKPSQVIDLTQEGKIIR